MKTKILSVLLACLMVLSVLPMTAFAEGAHTHAASCKGEYHDRETCPDARKVKEVSGLCGKQGYTVYQCPVCEDYFADDFTDPTYPEHLPTLVEGFAATCFEKGRADYWYCTNCEHYFSDAACTKDLGTTEPTTAVEINKLWNGLHNFVVTGQDGNCVEGGYVYYKCSDCETTKKEEISTTGKGHVWSERPTNIEEPKGCEDGLATYTCTVDGCGAEKQVVIVSDAHTLKKFERVEPTCEEDGNIEYYYCTTCKTIFETAECKKVLTADETVLPATDHDWVETSTDPGNCNTPATHYYTCNNCGETKEETDPEAAHSFGEPLKREATCTKWGALIRVCENCGWNQELETYEPTGHMTYDQAKEAGLLNVVKTPTCTEDGYATWTCGNTWKDIFGNDVACDCTDEFNSVDNATDLSKKDLAAAGHDLAWWTGAEPTCAKDGYKFQYCTHVYCDEYAAVSNGIDENGVVRDVKVNGSASHFVPDSIVILPKDDSDDNHDWVSETLNPSRCEDGYIGNEVYVCKICRKHKLVDLPAAEHNWDAGVEVIIQNQTCVLPEITKTTYTCLECGATDETEEETKPAAGHDETDIYVSPTCVSPMGYTLYTCSVCSNERRVYNPEDVVPDEEYEYATVEDAEVYHANLTLIGPIQNMEGNCYTKGLYRYSCSDCGYDVLVVIEGTGEHAADDGIYDTADGEVAPKAPTCTEDGTDAIYRCPTCGDLVHVDANGDGKATIPAGHTYGDLISGTAATCTTTGVIDHYDCSACDKYFDADKNEVATIVISALGHDLFEVPEVPADCENAGVSKHNECTRCDYTDEIVIPALGHAWTDVKEVSPTCYSTGVEAHQKCDTCGVLGQGGVVVKAKDLVMEKVGHKLVLADNRTPATCEEYAYIHWICEYCKGDVNQDKIFDDKDITAEKITDYVAAYQHPVDEQIKIDGKAPTCQDEGLTDGYECGLCHKVLVEQKKIDKIPHNNGPEYGNQDIVNDCQDTVENRHCVMCDQDIPKECQKFFELTVDPTCLVDGYYLNVCVACEKSYVKDVILAPGHKEGLPQIENEDPADCLNPGSYDTVVRCTVCNEVLSSETTIVDALGHVEPDENDWIVDKEPTIYAEGHAYAECDRCGYVFNKTLDKLPGIQMLLSTQNDDVATSEVAIENGVDPTKVGYTDSSRVALTVTMKSLEVLEAWGVQFSVQYSDNLVFDGFEWADENEFSGLKDCTNITATENYVNIMASVPNNADKQTQNTTIGDEVDGDMTFITLYFIVANGEINGVSTEAWFEVVQDSVLVIDKDHNEMNGGAEARHYITIGKYMDTDADGDVNFHDVLYGNDSYCNNEYKVELDIDKDGELTLYDLYQIMLYVNETIDYECIIAGGNGEMPY